MTGTIQMLIDNGRMKATIAELLDDLRAIAEFCEGLSTGEEGDIMDAPAEMARRAIAKATGGEK